MTTILEGLWEEIEGRADELRGKRVQVRVLEKAPRVETEEEKQARLRAALMSCVGVITDGPPDLSERAEEYFAQIMDEKYRRSQNDAD